MERPGVHGGMPGRRTKGPAAIAKRTRPRGRFMTRTAGDINMRVGVAKEIAPGERRVALVPESIDKLRAAGMSVFVERGAGVEAAFPDSAYVATSACGSIDPLPPRRSTPTPVR